MWLSEIMLQQTQVSTVLGYFERFLHRFPRVQDLAVADLDEVLALWAGLGYYSRARNLHRCARQVVGEHGGQFPASAQVLETLPGIGPSTAAAIAAFCFDERISILDGNVKRVLTRWLGFGEDLSKSAAEKVLHARAHALVPPDRVDMPAYTQGLMDLGATVCLPKAPRCEACPMASDCRARQEGDPLRYPVRTRRTRRGTMENGCLWVRCGEAAWLVQRPSVGVWAGLWTPPLFDSCEVQNRWVDQLQSALRGTARRLQVRQLPSFVHVLTHRDWTLHPGVLDASAEVLSRLESHLIELGPGRWVNTADVPGLALPAPMQRLWAEIQ